MTLLTAQSLGVNLHEAPIPLLQIQLFGPAAASIGGKPIRKLRSRKGMWLLAILTLRTGREVDRQWLAGTLWPDSADSQAYYNLRENLFDLRKALGPHGDRLVSSGPRSLRLEVDARNADVLAFDYAISRGGPDFLDQAVALHRGPLLEGCMEDWALAERERREQAYIAALTELGRQAMEIRDFEGAIRRLRLALLSDALREDTHRLLMEALASAGNHAAAALVYRDLRLMLHRELNAAPDPETTALFEKIRAEGQKRAAAVAAESQATGDRTTDARRGIPNPLTRLVGRESEIMEVCANLRSSRLVTLIGAGGVGKTRLAIQAAHDAGKEMLNGAWWVELASVSRPEDVLYAVAFAVGIQSDSDRGSIHSLVAHFRCCAGVLVLDNCEHVLNAAASLVTDLLQSCPQLRILATSRERLGITGERTYRTPSLSLPDRLDAILLQDVPGRPTPENAEPYQLVGKTLN